MEGIQSDWKWLSQWPPSFLRNTGKVIVFQHWFLNKAWTTESLLFLRKVFIISLSFHWLSLSKETSPSWTSNVEVGRRKDRLLFHSSAQEQKALLQTFWENPIEIVIQEDLVPNTFQIRRSPWIFRILRWAYVGSAISEERDDANGYRWGQDRYWHGLNISMSPSWHQWETGIQWLFHGSARRCLYWSSLLHRSKG